MFRYRFLFFFIWGPEPSNQQAYPHLVRYNSSFSFHLCRHDSKSSTFSSEALTWPIKKMNRLQGFWKRERISERITEVEVAMIQVIGLWQLLSGHQLKPAVRPGSLQVWKYLREIFFFFFLSWPARRIFIERRKAVASERAIRASFFSPPWYQAVTLPRVVPPSPPSHQPERALKRCVYPLAAHIQIINPKQLLSSFICPLAR